MGYWEPKGPSWVRAYGLLSNTGGRHANAGLAQLLQVFAIEYHVGPGQSRCFASLRGCRQCRSII